MPSQLTKIKKELSQTSNAIKQLDIICKDLGIKADLTNVKGVNKALKSVSSARQNAREIRSSFRSSYIGKDILEKSPTSGAVDKKLSKKAKEEIFDAMKWAAAVDFEPENPKPRDIPGLGNSVIGKNNDSAAASPTPGSSGNLGQDSGGFGLSAGQGSKTPTTGLTSASNPALPDSNSPAPPQGPATDNTTGPANAPSQNNNAETPEYSRTALIDLLGQAEAAIPKPDTPPPATAENLPSSLPGESPFAATDAPNSAPPPGGGLTVGEFRLTQGEQRQVDAARQGDQRRIQNEERLENEEIERQRRQAQDATAGSSYTGRYNPLGDEQPGAWSGFLDWTGRTTRHKDFVTDSLAVLNDPDLPAADREMVINKLLDRPQYGEKMAEEMAEQLPEMLPADAPPESVQAAQALINNLGSYPEGRRAIIEMAGSEAAMRDILSSAIDPETGEFDQNAVISGIITEGNFLPPNVGKGVKGLTEFKKEFDRINGIEDPVEKAQAMQGLRTHFDTLASQSRDMSDGDMKVMESIYSMAMPGGSYKSLMYMGADWNLSSDIDERLQSEQDPKKREQMIRYRRDVNSRLFTSMSEDAVGQQMLKESLGLGPEAVKELSEAIEAGSSLPEAIESAMREQFAKDNPFMGTMMRAVEGAKNLFSPDRFRNILNGIRNGEEGSWMSLLPYLLMGGAAVSLIAGATASSTGGRAAGVLGGVGMLAGGAYMAGNSGWGRQSLTTQDRIKAELANKKEEAGNKGA